MNKSSIRSHTVISVEEAIGWLESHPRKRIDLRVPGRTYPGEGTAARLINYLNSYAGSRIERLLAEAENWRAVAANPQPEMFAKLLQKFNAGGPPTRAVEDLIRRAPDPDLPRQGNRKRSQKLIT